jgi:hypothetical protein
MYTAFITFVAICVKYVVPICLRIYINCTDGGLKRKRGSVIFFFKYAQNVRETQSAPNLCGTEFNLKYRNMAVESRNGRARADVHC